MDGESVLDIYNRIIPIMTIWVNTQEPVVHEVNILQNTQHCMILFTYEVSKMTKFQEIEIKMMVAKGLGEGRMNGYPAAIRFSYTGWIIVTHLLYYTWHAVNSTYRFSNMVEEFFKENTHKWHCCGKSLEEKTALEPCSHWYMHMSKCTKIYEIEMWKILHTIYLNPALSQESRCHSLVLLWIPVFSDLSICLSYALRS